MVLPGFREAVVTVDLAQAGAPGRYQPQEHIATVHEALVLGLRDYLGKCGFRQAVMGLSGGVDSAVTCCLAVAALGRENVLGVLMPSPYTCRDSIDDSLVLARNLGVETRLIPISPIYESYRKALEGPLNLGEIELTLENIQARIRGNILMAISNKVGHMVLSTGNKSELAVGYCTLYGDMSGGLGVLADVPKTMVYELAAYLNRDREIIPEQIISKAPSAELRPDQPPTRRRAGTRQRSRRCGRPAGRRRASGPASDTTPDATGPNTAKSARHGPPAAIAARRRDPAGDPIVTDAATPALPVSPAPASPGRDVLAHAEAVARAARVSGVAYEIALDLAAGATTYRGVARIRFAVSGPGDLFLDFRGGSIESLRVNGTPISPDRPGARIVLPAAVLGPTTEVVVAYENAYDATGDGFHRFVDPADGAEYAYTNFEPFEAHRLYPCFDQPDLKGTFAFSVTAPASWSVISNNPADAIEEAPDGRRIHRFGATPPIATYVSAVVAGDWVGVTDATGPVPLGAWTRRSLAAHLDPGEIFEVTRQGMDFYADLFARPYPFRKYDQIFVPEFNAGAMENAGAVTFTESHVYRDPPTESQRLSRAETILHELAHMWFGDLATMRWWDDLWLNESFATYVSNLALAEATRFEGAWRAFHADMKRWGYLADERSTTHPIAGPVVDTDATFYNFDGITYGKGAAVLKQLVAMLGRAGFRDGLRVYFDRYAWSNASLSDFLDALEAGSGRPLRAWAHSWLETAAVNTLESRWTVRDGTIERMELTQDAPDAFPTLRPHTLEIALVRQGADGGPATVEALPIRIDGAEAWVEAAAGRPVPDLVFPNHADHAYAKVRLDERSVAALPGLLPEVRDPLLRQLLWSTLWEMTRDARLPAARFVALALELLPLERDDEIVLGALDATRGALARYVPEARRVAEAHAFVHGALGMLDSLPPGDLRRMWLRAAIDAVAEPGDAGVLTGILDGSVGLPEVTIDQEMRWSIVWSASAFGLPDSAARVAAELRRDPTDRGERAAIHAAVAAPLPDAKAEAWRRIHAEGYGSLHRTRAAMRGLHHVSQRTLLEPYVDEFFVQAPVMAATREHEFMRGYVAILFPAYRIEAEILARTRDVAAAAAQRLPTLRRQLTEAADDMARALRARTAAEEA